jgi:hypothetical protein
VSLEALREDIMEKVINTTIPKKYLDKVGVFSTYFGILRRYIVSQGHVP